jgi:hypothetical protein
MFGKYNGFVSKARVSACMYFLVTIDYTMECIELAEKIHRSGEPTVAHNGNTQFKFNIQFMLPILLSEFFSARIRSFPTEIFFQTDFFFCEIYFQPKFIFSRNLFSAEICFSRNLFSADIYFQPKFVFSRNLFSAEICFQPKFIFNRNFVISHELPLTATDHVTDEYINVTKTRVSGIQSWQPFHCFMLHSFIKFAQNGRKSKSSVHLRTMWLSFRKQFQILS